MNAPKRHSTGFTLVELLVVIAIVALVAGIAVPGMARLMGFGRNNVDNAVRDVYGLLRAANVYASTFRVNTAVVYTVNRQADSVTGDPVLIVDGLGMARRVYKEELEKNLLVPRPTSLDENDALNESNDPAKTRAYILLSDPSGQIHLFPKNACMLEPLVSEATTFGGKMNLLGMLSIELYQLNGDGSITKVSPDTPDRSNTSFVGAASSGDFPLDSAFPAHVFTPTGVMEPQNPLKARWVLDIGPSPEADPEDRFVSPDYDSETGGVPMDPINIELYPATGRVKIAS